MSDELMTQDNTPMTLAELQDVVGSVTNNQELFDQLSAESAKYLPRLQLMTGNSQVVKDGEFPVNTFALIMGKTHTIIGKEVPVIAFSWRPMALDTSNDAIFSYHPSTDLFQDIKARSSIQNSGCQWGFQYLVWMPVQKCFATVYFGTITSRNESPAVQSNLGKVLVLKGQKIPNKKFGDYWSYAVAVSNQDPASLPSKEALLRIKEEFDNAEDSNVTVATSEEKAATDRAR